MEVKKSELEELKAMKAASGGGQNASNLPEGDIDLKTMLLSDQMESKVGKKLSEITTRRVIILVLIMLFSQPVFSVSTYMQEPNSYDYGLNLIQTLGPNTKGGQAAFDSMVEIQQEINTPLRYVQIVGNTGTELEWRADGFDVETYRKSEYAGVSLPSLDGDSEDVIYFAIYDLTTEVKLQAALGLVTTILVCTMLGSGAMLFSKLTTDLVISPIEDMIERVNKITADPLGAAHQEEERLLFEELAQSEAYD